MANIQLKDGTTDLFPRTKKSLIVSDYESLSSYSYYGRKVELENNVVRYKIKSETFTHDTTAQSLLVLGNILIVKNTGTGSCKIYNKETTALLGTTTGLSEDHSNILTAGVETPSGSSFPAIYSTHWEGTKGVNVYKINSDYTITKVQTITPSSSLLSSSAFGLGNTDFAVDNENGYLYSIVYKDNSCQEYEANKTCICKFNLPLLSAGSTITLDESDIIDSFEVENIATRQDGFIRNRLLYLNNGFADPYIEPRIRVIDLSAKCVVTTVSLKPIKDAECEGLCIEDNHLLVTFYDDNKFYELYFD